MRIHCKFNLFYFKCNCRAGEYFHYFYGKVNRFLNLNKNFRTSNLLNGTVYYLSTLVIDSTYIYVCMYVYYKFIFIFVFWKAANFRSVNANFYGLFFAQFF